MTNGVRGVLFDLDGTLYRMPLYMKPLLFVSLAPHGFRLPSYMNVRDNAAGVDMGSAGALMQRLSSELALATGINQQDALAWIEGPFYRRFVGLMPMLKGSRPGLDNLLRLLRARNIKLGVLSDFGRVRERLSRLSIDPELFDNLWSSEEAGALKPSARPFLLAAETWHLDPSQILVVGDRDDTDGAGARAVGAQMLLVSGGRHRNGGMSWTQACARLLELIPG